MAAKMDKEADGSSFVRLQIAITDPVAAQKVMDKRYLTGSVGGRAGKALCSISGEDLAAESETGRPRVPKYRRGTVYKGKLAFIDMQDISFKEYSFVNQPADAKSGVRSTKVASGEDGKPNSEGWFAKSSAFVLHMNEEDIYSVEEHDSLLKNMKKKESKPLYLHLKGSFLTAMALQESENEQNAAISLLSNEQVEKDTDLQENSNMDDRTQEDILAVTEGLSEDLSSIASGKAEEANQEGTEETPEQDAPATEEAPASEEAEETKSEDNSETKEEQAEKAVDSDDSEKSEESDADPADDNQEPESSDEDLSDKVEQPAEQDNDDLDKVKALEEENKKLKEALHRILAERVVDAKISAGVESAESREELIESHVVRTASSLADSLRDVAKMPARKGYASEVPEITAESTVVNNESNVTTIGDEDEDVIEAPKEEVTLEQVFVDALMGRRKL
jgi:hypothetical protein